ncbi:hypothetical protein B0I08_105180 [Glaciihabitans tibetensis]|uniref:Uncharacterized protein n=1 Tax=Glaciihabitans tibetensis TaxID=1266600 RepID=A0A2T0VCW1_9MICO|nr:hypothetical protein [Glaciihabitans tibetensis]PRY68016.1 hypothetical protein B0I08_105180 [Glaciihabitans tibetensis]
MRRVFISWAIAFVVLLGAFAVTVVAMNATLYSSSGFVDTYLNALARQDATSARELPGVLASEDSAANLLTDGALGELSEIELIGNDVDSDGVHTLSYEYNIGGELAESSFRVVQTGAFLGLFPTWKFESSPLATVAVTVLHDDRFRANAVDLTADDQPTASGGFLVFAPGLYTFDHESTYLEADSVAVPISEPGSVTAVQVDVQANTYFTQQVSNELKEFLDGCATQEVLLPTGCPFGKGFENRIDTTPVWSIATYPDIEVIPGETVGDWLVPQTPAAAHLQVEVRSLFDGTRTQFDEDVPFTVSYDISIDANDKLFISALFS